MEETVKICKGCGRLLPLSEYHVNNGYKDGHDTKCKKCHIEMKKRGGSAVKAQKAQEQKQETQPTTTLADFSNKLLFAELRRRGFSGELRISQSYTI